MINKPRKTTVPSLRKTLSDIRKSLQESIPGYESKAMVPVEFSRIGTHYRIENAPVPPTDKIGLKLEKSFNDFLKQVRVDYHGTKLRGKALIDTKDDILIMEYENLEKRDGVDVVKSSKGMLLILDSVKK